MLAQMNPRRQIQRHEENLPNLLLAQEKRKTVELLEIRRFISHIMAPCDGADLTCDPLRQSSSGRCLSENHDNVSTLGIITCSELWPWTSTRTRADPWVINPWTDGAWRSTEHQSGTSAVQPGQSSDWIPTVCCCRSTRQVLCLSSPLFDLAKSETAESPVWASHVL